MRSSYHHNLCLCFSLLLLPWPLRSYIYIMANCLQFMRPRSRDKKLQEEWAVPLKSVEDIHKVMVSLFLIFGTLHKKLT